VIGINSLPADENCRWDEVIFTPVLEGNGLMGRARHVCPGKALKMLIFRDKLSFTPAPDA
jgi:hypothetical protein